MTVPIPVFCGHRNQEIRSKGDCTWSSLVSGIVEEQQHSYLLLHRYKIIYSFAKQNNSDHSYFFPEFVQYYSVNPFRHETVLIAIHRGEWHSLCTWHNNPWNRPCKGHDCSSQITIFLWTISLQQSLGELGRQIVGWKLGYDMRGDCAEISDIVRQGCDQLKCFSTIMYKSFMLSPFDSLLILSFPE